MATEATDAPETNEQHPRHSGVPTEPQTPPGGSPETQNEAAAPNPSPVAELREAAAKLRRHIKHATDGPWVTSSVWSPRAASTSAVYSHAHPTGTVDSEVVASGRIRSGYGGIRNPWNAEYIALMQPAVGATLAELLDTEADVAETMRTQAPDMTDEQLAGFVHGPLAIARLINHGMTA
jgi:hypothetical protein